MQEALNFFALVKKMLSLSLIDHPGLLGSRGFQGLL